MSLNFNNFNLGGNNGGGGGASNNYIPAGTTITVGTDKTYQSIQSAYNSLEGKWSDGIVTIKIDDGTYNEKLVLNKICNIPNLVIEGTTKTGTVIHYEPTADWGQVIYVTKQKLTFKNITVECIDTYNYSGFNIDTLSTVYLDGVVIKDMKYRAILASGGSNVYVLDGGLIISNASTKGTAAVHTILGSLFTCSWNKAISISNFTTAFSAANGGTNALNDPVLTFTSVTTQYSPALNNMSGTGWNFKV